MATVAGQPEVMNSIGAVQTAAELRRQLHTMKAKDREAVTLATNGQTISAEGFLKSKWATALFTGIATFLLLYATNPSFIQESTDKQRSEPTPSMRKVLSWSVLATLVVALGPYMYQKWTGAAA